jgi:hypothetical protein
MSVHNLMQKEALARDLNTLDITSATQTLTSANLRDYQQFRCLTADLPRV